MIYLYLLFKILLLIFFVIIIYQIWSPKAESKRMMIKTILGLHFIVQYPEKFKNKKHIKEVIESLDYLEKSKYIKKSDLIAMIPKDKFDSIVNTIDFEKITKEEIITLLKKQYDLN